MSYHCYTVDGYGICTSNINTTKERIENMLALAPKFNSVVQKWIDEFYDDEVTIETYLDYDEDFYSGLAYLMQEVIEEVENINFAIASDFDNEWYLLLEPWYPWSELLGGERKLESREQVDAILQKYISVLTDEEIDIDYQSVENGG